MPEPDKILEAEQSIQNIAAELKKMRNAAGLLQDAQEKTDAILDASERIIAATKEFSHACGDIIRRLSATDLTQRLDAVHREIDRIAGFVNEQAKKTSDAIAVNQSKLEGLEVALQSVAKESEKQLSATDLTQRLDAVHREIDRIAGFVNEQAKKTSDAIAVNQSKLEGLEVALQSVAKESEKQYRISIVFIILTLAAAFAALVTTLL